MIFSTLFTGSVIGDVNYTAFIFPGILVMTVLSGAGISGIATYSNKEKGSFYRMIISPVKRGSVVLGHVLDAAVLCLIQSTVLSIIAFVMSVRIETGIPGFLLAVILLFVVVFFAAGFSYAMSMVIPDENAFIAMINTVTLPLFFLSTALLTKDRAPGAFKVLISINPFTYAIDSLRNLINDNSVNWMQYGIAIGLFLALGFAAFMMEKKTLYYNTRL